MSPKVVLTEALPTSGALTYWRLEGALDVPRLTAEWSAAGLPEALLPSTPSPASALTRAVREQQKGRLLVRPLEGKAGYAVVAERAKGDDLAHAVELLVKLDAIGRPTFYWPSAPGWYRTDHPLAPVHALAPSIAASYERHLNECSAEDVGAWLVRMVAYVDGVSLRDTGGIYYVPPATLGAWERVTSCVTEVSSHRTFRIPAMRAEDTVAAVLDAVEQEASREFDAMMAEVGRGDLGARALDTRASRTGEVEAKVERYEAMLGVRLGAFRERLEELRAALAAASLKASAVEDRERGT